MFYWNTIDADTDASREPCSCASVKDPSTVNSMRNKRRWRPFKFRWYRRAREIYSCGKVIDASAVMTHFKIWLFFGTNRPDPADMDAKSGNSIR
jgi:hypothetical protein